MGHRHVKAFRSACLAIANEVMLDTELIGFICLENEKSAQHFR